MKLGTFSLKSYFTTVYNKRYTSSESSSNQNFRDMDKRQGEMAVISNKQSYTRGI
jgi:hypothetical protein